MTYLNNSLFGNFFFLLNLLLSFSFPQDFMSYNSPQKPHGIQFMALDNLLQ